MKKTSWKTRDTCRTTLSAAQLVLNTRGLSLHPFLDRRHPHPSSLRRMIRMQEKLTPLFSFHWFLVYCLLWNQHHIKLGEDHFCHRIRHPLFPPPLTIISWLSFVCPLLSFVVVSSEGNRGIQRHLLVKSSSRRSGQRLQSKGFSLWYEVRFCISHNLFFL